MATRKQGRKWFRPKCSYLEDASDYSHCYTVQFYLTVLCTCCSFAQSCSSLCDLMDCSMPSFPVPHHLPELAQTHVLQVSNAILSSVIPSPLAFQVSGPLVSHCFCSAPTLPSEIFLKLILPSLTGSVISGNIVPLPAENKDDK